MLSWKWIHFPLSRDDGCSPHVYINQRLQIQFRAPDDERRAARNMLRLHKRWNNKVYYKVASSWLFLLIHTTMHGSMNIKPFKDEAQNALFKDPVRTAL
jgi:hypothetical protein